MRHELCLEKNARCFIDVPHRAFTPVLAVYWLRRFFAVVECLLPVAWLFGPAELVAWLLVVVHDVFVKATYVAIDEKALCPREAKRVSSRGVQWQCYSCSDIHARRFLSRNGFGFFGLLVVSKE